MPAFAKGNKDLSWRAFPADGRNRGICIEDDPHRRLTARMASSTTLLDSFSFWTDVPIASSAARNRARAASSSILRSRSYSSADTRKTWSAPRRPMTTGSPEDASRTSLPSCFRASSTGTYRTWIHLIVYLLYITRCVNEMEGLRRPM